MCIQAVGSCVFVHDDNAGQRGTRERALVTWKSRLAENATTVVTNLDVCKKLFEAGKGLELVAVSARGMASIIDVLSKRIRDCQGLSSRFADAMLDGIAKKYNEDMRVPFSCKLVCLVS